MLRLIFDGGNGGYTVNKGYGSFKIYTDDGLLYHCEKHIFDGYMTSNEAEYHTLILALKWISDTIDDPVSVYGVLSIEGDSELVRNQVLGNWQVKQKHLQPLCKEIQHLLLLYPRWNYIHIPRKDIVKELGH